MPHIVEVPELGNIEFPDEMSDDEIRSVIQQKLPSKSTVPENLSLDLTSGGRLSPGGLKAESGMESGTELTTELAGSGQRGMQAVGKGLTTAGKSARDIAAAYGFELLGQPELQAAQLGVDPEDVKRAGMIPEPESEKTPIELGMESLPTAARIPSEAAYGLIETAPRLAGVAALQAGGVPAPVGAALMFGPTEQGFDVKQASIAAAIPFVGKYSGEIAGLIAKRFGVATDTALNAVKAGGSVLGPAAGLVAEGELEISRLPKEQQHDARIQMWAGVLGQSALGLTGLKPETKGAPNASEVSKASVPSGIGGRGGVDLRIAETAGRLSDALRKGNPDDLQHILAGAEMGPEELGRLSAQLPKEEQAALQAIGDASFRGRSISDAAEEAIAIFNRQKETGQVAASVSGEQNPPISRVQERGAAQGPQISREGVSKTETTQQERKLGYASEIGKTKTLYGSLRSFAAKGKGQVPVEESGGGVQPQTEGQAQRSVLLTADQLVKMDPEQLVQWKKDALFGPLHTKEIGESLNAEDVAKLKTHQEQLDQQTQDALSEVTSPSKIDELKKTSPEEAAELEAKNNEAFGKTLRISFKAQTLREIVADYDAKVIRSTLKLPKYEEIGAGKETAAELSKSERNPESGLPPDVPDNGPNFPSELLEASRRLGTLVRSRTTLQQGVAGQYKRARIGQDDSIEVGDIRNQLTVSHEMGHDLDALIFPGQNLAHTQKSLGDRVGQPGKAIQSELIPVSELMRGPITGSPGHKAYRKRATELIADFFALYSHDPARAKAMAPKFAAGFEAALKANPDAAETIRQLHAGNVEPIAPQTALPPTGQPAEMPGAVPLRPQPSPIARDRELAVASEDLVKGLVRKFKSEVEVAGIKSDRWRERVPDQKDRNDVGAFAEGISNLEIPGDTIDAVKARMTPEMKRLKKDYSFDIELQRQRINEYLKGSTEGEYLSFLEDYLPHFYVNSKTPAGLQAIARFRKESPNAKQRKIPTLREAVDYGLIPISQDPAVLYENTAAINWRVATNRKLLSELKNMQSGGQPIIMPPSEAPPGWPKSNNPLIQRVYARQTAGGTLLWQGGAAIHPDAWRAVRMMLEMPTEPNALLKAFDAINSLTRVNAFAFSLFHDVTLRSASLGAQMKWYNPARGLFRLFERNPLTGELEFMRSSRGIGKELMKDEQSVSDAALHGLEFAWHSSDTYQHAARQLLDKLAVQLRDTPVIGKTARIARDIQRWRQEGLWKNTHDALKIASYEDIVAKAIQDLPADAPPQQVKAIKGAVASFLNDAFGGQEWQTKFWLSPNTRRMLARLWLAPDWTQSTIRSVPFASDIASVVRGQAPRLAGKEPIAARGEGLTFDVVKQTPTGQQRITYNDPTYGGRLRLKFWTAEIAALATATVAAQYAIYHAFGDKEKGDKEWMWENELGQNRRVDATPLMRQLPWRDKDDPTRYYINLGKRPEEILGWVTHLDQNIFSKMSRPLAELVRQITGTEGDFKAEWKRDHEAFIESLPSRAKSIAGTLIPFTFSGNQFALSLPYRKGMTKYKAQEAYQSAYELIAEPNRFRSVLREQTTDLDKLIDQITDAAERNGVTAELIRRQALSSTRGKYYDQYFKALQKDDEKAMNSAAEALSNLGATSKGLQESIQRKMSLQPQ